MSTDIRLPHRGNAYQPRATLWVCHAPNPRVLKERRISPNDGRVPVNPSAAFLQNASISLSPFPGFHPGLVCMAPLEPKTLLIETPQSTRPLNHTFPHSLPSPFVLIRVYSWSIPI